MKGLRGSGGGRRLWLAGKSLRLVLGGVEWSGVACGYFARDQRACCKFLVWPERPRVQYIVHASSCSTASVLHLAVCILLSVCHRSGSVQAVIALY